MAAPFVIVQGVRLRCTRVCVLDIFYIGRVRVASLSPADAVLRHPQRARSSWFLSKMYTHVAQTSRRDLCVIIMRWCARVRLTLFAHAAHYTAHVHK